MKYLLYIANIRLPTEKAHGLQIMEMASALSQQGIDVELVVPRRKNHLHDEPFAFYALPSTFRITRIFTWDLVRFGRVGFIIQSWTFSFAALIYALRRKMLVYSRDELLLSLLALFGKDYVFEPHIAKWHPIQRTALMGATLIVPISEGLKEFYVRKGVPGGRMFVAPDGVNLSRFTHTESREVCRTMLDLPKEKKIVLYSGHLYQRKGAQTLAEAASALPKDTVVVFVGGTAQDIATFKQKYGNDSHIVVVGHRPHQEIPYYLTAADLLVLPNSGISDDSRLYTSPMKLFEYMASGVPIIASDVPSLREVLHDGSATFVTPDDAHTLSVAITGALANPKKGKELAGKARQDVLDYSWEKRAAAIVREIESRA